MFSTNSTSIQQVGVAVCELSSRSKKLRVHNISWWTSLLGSRWDPRLNFDFSHMRGRWCFLELGRTRFDKKIVSFLVLWTRPLVSKLWLLGTNKIAWFLEFIWLGWDANVNPPCMELRNWREWNVMTVWNHHIVAIYNRRLTRVQWEVWLWINEE